MLTMCEHKRSSGSEARDLELKVVQSVEPLYDHPRATLPADAPRILGVHENEPALGCPTLLQSTAGIFGIQP
jgi:hypothetical protein